MEWKKMFVNDMTDKGLISKIYKQFMQCNNKKPDNNKEPNQKMGRRPEQIFFQRNHRDGEQAHEKMLTQHH